MVKSGPFRIPDRCADCPGVQARLTAFEAKKTEIIDEFTNFGTDLETCEAIFHDESEPFIDLRVEEYLRDRFREAADAISSLTLKTQTRFEIAEAYCPGFDSEQQKCNYPEGIIEPPKN